MSEIEIKANIPVYRLLNYIWGNIEQSQKNDAALEILEMLKNDPDVCKIQLECFKFYLHEKEVMPKVTSFSLGNNNNLIASQMDI